MCYMQQALCSFYSMPVSHTTQGEPTGVQSSPFKSSQTPRPVMYKIPMMNVTGLYLKSTNKLNEKKKTKDKSLHFHPARSTTLTMRSPYSLT